MSTTQNNQRIYLDKDKTLEFFLLEKRSQSLSPRTVDFYKEKISRFFIWLKPDNLLDITDSDIKRFLIYLEENGNSAGGRHSYFRSIKVFFRWIDSEFEPENWKNPILKVKPPKVVIEPLQGVSLAEVEYLLSFCQNNRDKALIRFLVDTGVRASELTNITMSDYDLVSGRVEIKKGKGKKSRILFTGAKTRKDIRKYVSGRQHSEFLFCTKSCEKLTYNGLREILRRLKVAAGFKRSLGLHDFRRCFAVTLYRKGVDVITISKLMGHSTLEVLKRYLSIKEDDLKNATKGITPGDLI